MKTLPLLVAISVLALFLSGCGGESSSGTDSTTEASSPSKPTKTLVLPGDLDQLTTDATIEIQYSELGTLRMVVTDAQQPLKVTMPAGTKLKPIGADAPTFLALEDRTFDFESSGKGVFNVIYADVEEWGKENSRQKFEIIGREESAPLLSYCAAVFANHRKMSWSKKQIGAWIVHQNIPVKKLFGKHVAESIVMAPGLEPTVYRIYSYRTVKTLRPLLEEAGLNPDDYRIFDDNEKEYKEDLAAYQLKDWGDKIKRASIGNKFSGLDDYKEEPQVIQLLLDYVHNHKMPYYRVEAARYLFDIDAFKDKSDEELYGMATTDSHRLIRMTAARILLVRRKDQRAEPILAAYGYDGLALPKEMGKMRYDLEQAHEVKLQPGESLVAFWARTGGWDRLAGAADVANLKRIVAEMEASETKRIDDLLASLPPTAGKEIYEPLARWSDWFRRYRPALDWVARVLKENSEQNVRISALQNLVHFEEFDVTGLLIHVIENDPSREVRRRALSRNWAEDSTKAKPVFLRLAKSSDKAARTAAMQKAAAEWFDSEVEQAIIQVAREDDDMKVRLHAVEALARLEAPGAVPTIEYVVARPEPANNPYTAQQAVQLLVKLMPGETGLEKMKTIARDNPSPKVRVIAVIKLGDYAKKKLPIADFLIDRIQQDDDASVRNNAVRLAYQTVRYTQDDASAVRAIELGLADAEPSVRRVALDGIKSMKLESMVPAAIKIAEADGDKKTRNTAFELVKRMDKDRCVDILAKWAKSEDASMRKDAVEQLRRSFKEDPRAAEIVEPLRDDPDKRVKYEVERFFK